jgi:hypothetical protein
MDVAAKISFENITWNRASAAIAGKNNKKGGLVCLGSRTRDMEKIISVTLSDAADLEQIRALYPDEPVRQEMIEQIVGLTTNI